MSLKAGIVGLPNVGKSTLFNSLTAAKALAANYPFATKDPNIGIIQVPDSRLDKLSELVQPKETIPTTVEIVDIAGLIKGASKGEGLGNQFLANIREVDAILHVVRCFDDANVMHVDGGVDPVRDKEIIETELLLKDLETAEKRVEKYRKAAKSGEREAVKSLGAAEKILDHLEEGNPARELKLTEQEEEILKELSLLTAKPVLYICNVDEMSVVGGNQYSESLRQNLKEEEDLILISAAIEEELLELDSDEQKEFLEEMGLEEPGVNRVIRKTYDLLNLITFFTAGEKEVRAWTVLEGSTAPEAAGVIHSDFEKGFIRAEVISYENFVSYGSEVKVREAGKQNIEGKDYIVRDGDVMHFRFNV